MSITDLLKRGELFVEENSPTILTAIGVTGTITTAVLTGRASYKAAQIIDRDMVSRVGAAATKAVEEDVFDDVEELSSQEKFKMTWKLYIPPVGAGTVTVSSIIMANRVASKKTAALAAAYGLSERAFQEYREKVVQKIGEAKAQAVTDAVAQDRVNANPLNTREVIIAGTGEVLCFDMLSGRYFQSSVEKIRKAENEINYEIVNHMYASLSRFYEEIGLPATMFSNDVGFNIENRVEVNFSTVLSVDDRPCLAISFAVGPVQNYQQLY